MTNKLKKATAKKGGRALFLLTSFLVISLTSCTGWRLRGTDTSTQLLNDSIYFSGQTSTTYSLIEQQLNKKDALTDFSSASYRLIINKEEWKRRRASVTRNISTAEYELTLRVGYSILSGNNQVIRPETKAQITRSYTFDENDVAGKDKEEEIIRRDMRRTIARQILFQVQLVQR